MTTDIRSIHSVEFEGFYYVESNDGLFGKGCSRCGGTGHYSFNGVDSICYKCSNVWEYRMGDLFDTRAEAEKWCHQRAVRKAQADRKREAAHAKLLFQYVGKVQDVMNRASDVAEFLLQVNLHTSFEEEEGVTYEKDTFVIAMAEALQYPAQADKAFSDRMIEAVRKVIAKRTERTAEQAAHPAPTGRVAVTGEVVSAKVQEGDYGTNYKILVKDDQGFKVWVSLPSEQRSQQHDDFYDWVQAKGSYIGDFGPWCFFLGTDDFAGVKGRRITFTATLTPSRDDVSFAFGSRPPKGAWL